MANCTGETVQQIIDIAGFEVDPPDDIASVSFNSGTGQPNKGILRKRPAGDPNAADLHLLGIISRNQRYVEELRRKAGELIKRYQTANLRTPQQYYNRRTGKYQPFEPFSNRSPIDNTGIFLQLAWSLAVLVFNKAISPDTKLGVRPVDRNNGEFCTPDEVLAKNILAQELGFPSAGYLTLSSRATNVNRFGFTYTGVDLQANAVFGNLVTEAKGLNAVSWSIHADKNPDRRLHEKRPKAFTKGAETIAGTLIFTMFDEDPIRAITPNEFFHGHIPIANETGFTGFNENLATEVPAFDLFITLTNEYGATSAMTIWGVDITDAGGLISMRQLENEIAVQYKAMAMDPLKQVAPGPEGEIDFLTTEGQELFKKKRRFALMQEVASENFEEMYNITMDTIFKNVSAREWTSSEYTRAVPYTGS